MLLKYNIELDNEKIEDRIKQLINLIYKLLPMREEKSDWQTLLATINEEIAGMRALMPHQYDDLLFTLVCKLEGLFSLSQDSDFLLFRRTVFECLNLMGRIKEYVSSR